MIDSERRLSWFSIPLVEGAHVGARALSVTYMRSPIPVGRRGSVTCSYEFYLPYAFVAHSGKTVWAVGGRGGVSNYHYHSPLIYPLTNSERRWSEMVFDHSF
jgi:hypothetical protein